MARSLQLSSAPRTEYGIDATTAMSAYAMLGRFDEAFAELERARLGHYEFYLANLFQGAGAAMRRDPRFLFPAIATHLQLLGPLSLTGGAQRTGPHRPVTAGPATTQAREGSRNHQAHRWPGRPM